MGFANYKSFCLFLLYSDLLAAFVCSTALWSLIQVLDEDLEVNAQLVRGWWSADPSCRLWDLPQSAGAS